MCGVEAIVLAKCREEGAFGEKFCGGGGDEEFVGVERVDDCVGGEIVELDAEIGVFEFGAVDDFLDAVGERGGGVAAAAG